MTTGGEGPNGNVALLQEHLLESHHDISQSQAHCRTILSHFARNATASSLMGLADAAESSQQVGLLGVPRAYFSFGERSSRLSFPLPESMPLLGVASYSIWLWLRWEGPSAQLRAATLPASDPSTANGIGNQTTSYVSVGPQAGPQAVPQAVLELLGMNGMHGLQLLLVNGALRIRVLSSKGGCSDVQACSPDIFFYQIRYAALG